MQNKIDHFGEQLEKLKDKIRDAKTAKDENLAQNVEQLHTQIHAEQEKLNDCIEKIESESLMSKQTLHAHALQELKKLQ
jgi:hypothetical protein